MRKRWFRQLLRRRVFVILLLVLQGLVLIGLISNASSIARWINTAFRLLSILVGLRVVSSRDKPTYKLLWIVLILVFPVFGGLLYLLVTFQSSTGWVARRLGELEAASRPLLADGEHTYRAACERAPECVPQITYLKNSGFPVYDHTSCDYFSPGEAVFAALVPALKQARRYIFLEFFILQEGIMWNTIHDILREKVQEGVEVRVLYDDIGSFLTLPKDYAKRLNQEGIQCRVFNRFRPVLSSLQNNRDHRKIVSVDGEVAFTGGFNLADEYINAIEKPRPLEGRGDGPAGRRRLEPDGDVSPDVEPDQPDAGGLLRLPPQPGGGPPLGDRRPGAALCGQSGGPGERG